MPFSVFPRTICRTKSKISGEIVVKEHFGQQKLYVQGVLQSGGIIKDLWKKALRQVGSEETGVGRVLVLGLGGGTVVQIIRQYWPAAKIMGVEIDPEIIKIGRRFFDLDKAKGLKIINADAFRWLRRNNLNDIYHLSGGADLILVDLYLGSRFPKKAESSEFFKYLKKLLAPNGMVIFNRLRQRGEKFPQFEKKIRKHFSLKEKIKLSSNLFFIAGFS